LKKSRRKQQGTSPWGKRCRPRLEALEDRTLLSGGLPYPTPSTVSQLTADIVYANSNAGSYTITLAASTTFDFTSANNSTNGANALPVLTGNITIVGNGDTLDGSYAARLFDVASGASLTLENVTLTHGSAYGAGVAAEGGAIYSSGTLNLSGVTIRDNVAQGSNGDNGFSGYDGGVFGAIGGNGGNGGWGGDGASASGGGLYVAGGAVTLTNDTFSGNQANGGYGGNGGNGGNGGPGSPGSPGTFGWYRFRDYYCSGALTNTSHSSSPSVPGGRGGPGGNGGPGGWGGIGGAGSGGGLYVAGGTVTLNNDTLSSNQVYGGNGGSGGYGGGGGWGGPGGRSGTYYVGEIYMCGPGGGWDGPIYADHTDSYTGGRGPSGSAGPNLSCAGWKIYPPFFRVSAR
jgi:hypothetical protein